MEPESGKLAFYIIKPAIDDGFALMHLRVTNIPKEALLPDSVLTLVLLTEPQLFWDAPRITHLTEANDFALQGEMRKYWDK